MAANPNLVIGRQTDKGRVRPGNEDSIGTPGMFQIPRERLAQRGTLVAVADGMGGHAAGEVASQMAITALFKSYYAALDANPEAALRSAYSIANTEIYNLAASDPTKTRMGSTLTAALIQGDKLYVANVGDSRTYLIRQGTIRQMTQDHSWVAEQVRSGILTPDQAARHDNRSVITRAMGMNPELQVDVFPERLQRDDNIVLCSDGLTNEVAPQEILQIVTSASNPEAAAKRLIATANARGAKDNVSAIVVRNGAASPLPMAWIVGAATAMMLLLLGGIAFATLGGGGMSANGKPSPAQEIAPAISNPIAIPKSSPSAVTSPTVTANPIATQINPLNQGQGTVVFTPPPPTATLTPTAVPTVITVITDTPPPTKKEKPDKPTKEPTEPKSTGGDNGGSGGSPPCQPKPGKSCP